MKITKHFHTYPAYKLCVDKISTIVNELVINCLMIYRIYMANLVITMHLSLSCDWLRKLLIYNKKYPRKYIKSLQ